jgi:peptide chain release factor 3
MYKIQIGKNYGQKTPTLCEELELIDEVYLNLIAKIIWTENYNQSFGSALNNFGVRELLDCFVKSPHHHTKKSQKRE